MNRISRLEARGMRSHYIKDLTMNSLGQEVSICGWVYSVRSHGENLNFVDLTDVTGVVQVVFNQKISLSTGDVLKVVGYLRKRPEGTENPNLPTGEFEVVSTSYEVFSEAKPMPTPIDEHLYVEESTRLKYRFLDLRRKRMQKNIIFRAELVDQLRQSFTQRGFIEIETPLLWVPTPEGAREFVVPSRYSKGHFYALPQSPQIAKQLLMVAGFDRYFQVAKCLRDEDLRADRQFEFTQFDLETSFMRSSDIIELITDALKDAIGNLGFLKDCRFVELTYEQSYKRFGTDKPDMSIKQELVDVTDVFINSDLQALKGAQVISLALESDASRSWLDRIVDRAKALGAKGLLWIKINSDYSIESPVAKYLKDDEIKKLAEKHELVLPGVVLLMAGNDEIFAILGQIRLELAEKLTKNELFNFVWVTKFPLFEADSQGILSSAHHPFTMPDENTIEFLDSDPLKVLSDSYDLVLNGWELGSGSIRIHNLDLQKKIFSLLGLKEEQIISRFGFMLEAFSYGVPPHGGFAFGIDRLAALLLKEGSIREVIAFPKSQTGQDLMTGAPSKIETSRLKELGLKT